MPSASATPTLFALCMINDTGYLSKHERNFGIEKSFGIPMPSERVADSQIELDPVDPLTLAPPAFLLPSGAHAGGLLISLK